MTPIEFRLVNASERLNEACRLARQAVIRDQRVYIRCDSEADANHVQSQIGHEGVFASHTDERISQLDQHRIPLNLGRHAALSQSATLINVAASATHIVGRFTMVYDLIGDSESLKSEARTRYKHYRDRGYPLNVV